MKNIQEWVKEYKGNSDFCKTFWGGLLLGAMIAFIVVIVSM